MPETDGGRPRRYLRQSIYPPGGGAVTIVLSEEDLREEIHVAANALRSQGGDQDVEVFEHAGDRASATAEAERRGRTRIPSPERHKHTMHDWLIAMFKLVRPGGAIGNKTPAPFGAEDAREAVESASRHPLYGGQRVYILAGDGRLVALERGRLEVRGP